MEQKILNVGVISCSGMAQSHMLAVKAHERARLAAICDVDEEKLRQAGEKLEVDARYTDYRELLRHPGLDAVIIVTPDQLHREMVEAALDAGLHVLCEKPLALTREDLSAIVAAGKKSDRKLMVGQICRFTPGFVAAKKLVDEGRIGELYFVESEYAHDYQEILSLNGWRSDPIRNGVVGGGCHAVDLLRWLAGDPTEVTAYGTHKMLPIVHYDDCTIAILKFPGNVIGKVFVSTGCKREYTMRSVFYGTRGTIICDNSTPHITLFHEEEGKPGSASTPHEIDVQLADHNTFGEFRAFADAILNDTPVPTDAEQGARTIAACMAIVQSADEGRSVVPNYDFARS